VTIKDFFCSLGDPFMRGFFLSLIAILALGIVGCSKKKGKGISVPEEKTEAEATEEDDGFATETDESTEDEFDYGNYDEIDDEEADTSYGDDPSLTSAGTQANPLGQVGGLLLRSLPQVVGVLSQGGSPAQLLPLFTGILTQGLASSLGGGGGALAGAGAAGGLFGIQ
jgi:hypothetical protein